MNTFKKLAIVAGLCAAGLTSHSVQAQTTDGYHTIQVFPIVVDTASFTQRFTFRNPNSASVTISATYFPGTGTAQASAIGCNAIVIGANSTVTYSSLRSLCPAMAAGSNFGFLYTYETNAANLPYAAFSRVANPQGNGFSVESFPAHTFTSATTMVIGARRLAASGGNPAFQTNCFVANLNEITAGAGTSTDVEVTVYNSAGTILGAPTNFALTPGKLTRLLDVFNAVGAPAGDYDNARVQFWEFGNDEPGLMSFCTVQDNTSFGADFRIAKQEIGFGGNTDWIGGQDGHVRRTSTYTKDVTTSYGAGRDFKLLTGGSRHNIHVVYFRHPDWVQCELIDPNTGVRALQAYGLEMRMLGADGTTVLAGGNNLTGFGETYLGDKTESGEFTPGSNGRYTIEVENNAGNGGADIPYQLHCQSGSGHTMGDMIEYGIGSEKF